MRTFFLRLLFTLARSSLERLIRKLDKKFLLEGQNNIFIFFFAGGYMESAGFPFYLHLIEDD